jgi:hypothetical protein
VGNVRTGTTYNQVSPRWAIGNLRSLYGYAASDLYGAAFGDPSATNITIDATNGLRIRNGTTNKLTADTSGNLSLVGDFSMSTSGVFRAGATAFGTGTGWWMDYNSGTPRFRIGVPSSGNRLEWDGTNLVLVSANLTVNSSGVTIGGAPGGFSGSSAYNFTRPTGLGFGQSGDVFAMWFLSSSGLDDLVVQNKIVGTGTSDGIARVILKAQGWENNAGGSSTTESSIELNSGVANQQILLTAPVIDFAGSTRVSVSTALFRVTNASANLEVTNGTTTMSTQPGFFGTTSNHAWIAMTNNGTNATFCAAGGITIASPTGGCKGSGTLNATAVYDDNVLLTDWVFQLYYLGATANAQRVPATRSWPPARRLYTLSEVSTITQQEHRLPWMPRESEFETERHTGGMITRLYQGQEQQQIYIMELEARIRALEQATAAGRR